MRTPYEPARHDLDLANVLYALSDPIRLQIVAQVAAIGEQCCGTFDLPIAKSTLSHHMKTLREAGITQTRLKGMQRFISLRRHDLDARFPGLLDAVLRAARAGATGAGRELAPDLATVS
jgi:DNA-binding transcriptional ArsR family regulator